MRISATLLFDCCNCWSAPTISSCMDTGFSNAFIVLLLGKTPYPQTPSPRSSGPACWKRSGSQVLEGSVTSLLLFHCSVLCCLSVTLDLLVVRPPCPHLFTIFHYLLHAIGIWQAVHCATSYITKLTVLNSLPTMLTLFKLQWRIYSSPHQVKLCLVPVWLLQQYPASLHPLLL